MAKGQTFEQIAFLPASSIYLQEANDLLAAVREIKKFCRAEHVPAREYLDKQIIMARLLEALWHEGIESRRYECFAWNAAIQQVIHRKEDPALFIDACRVFALDRFQEIYLPATYTDKETWELFIARSGIAADCRKLLYVYIGRWLNGAGFEEYNRIKELGFDHYNIPEAEWTRLLIALPALIFSLHYLAETGEDDDLIRTIVATVPFEAGPFDAPTLWLQRKAAELYYEAKGVSAFLHYDPNIRQMVVAYMAHKKNLHSFTRRRLAKSILAVAGEFEVFDDDEIGFLLS